MAALKEQVIERQRFELHRCKGDPCKGCAGWEGLTPSGKNLCTELGDACIAEAPARWSQDATYTPSPEPAREQTAEEIVAELDELEW